MLKEIEGDTKELFFFRILFPAYWEREDYRNKREQGEEYRIEFLKH